jgi:hypothetical protein
VIARFTKVAGRPKTEEGEATKGEDGEAHEVRCRTLDSVSPWSRSCGQREGMREGCRHPDVYGRLLCCTYAASWIGPVPVLVHFPSSACNPAPKHSVRRSSLPIVRSSFFVLALYILGGLFWIFEVFSLFSFRPSVSCFLIYRHHPCPASVQIVLSCLFPLRYLSTITPGSPLSCMSCISCSCFSCPFRSICNACLSFSACLFSGARRTADVIGR